MRRGSEWYCLFCAAAKLRVPLVALSIDLPDKAAEKARNAEILAQHQPFLLVVDEGTGNGTAVQDASGQSLCTVTFRQLWEEAATAEVPATCDRKEPVLCYAYTGGTTEASRCVRITHQMALHEVKAYLHVASLGHSDMILQQHSVYWAASAYGEVDIALAYGCALVFCEAWDIDSVVAVIREHRVTCAGLVPSILAALRHEDMPSLRLVFTWGEALQARTAREWAKHVHLVDLLISTEYWLSLYADWTEHCKKAGASLTERPVFRTVPDTQVRIRERLDEDGEQIPGAGELLVAGPMVSLGYTDPKRTAEAFVEEGGVRWYCTKDCVELRDGGILFRGRADDLIKVGAKWFDVKELERKLQELDAVKEAHVYGRDAFAALRTYSKGVVPALRQELPADFSLRLLPALPKKPGTDKVDRKRLAEFAAPRKGLPQDAPQAERAVCELSSLLCWYSLLLLIVFAALLNATLFVVAEAAVEHPPLPSWAFLPAAFAVKAIWELMWRLLCLSYLVLLSLYWRRLPKLCNNIPFGSMGLLVFIAATLPTPMWGLLAAAPGLWKSWARRRLTSWPVVCAVGFPLWARQSGMWWASQGVSGSLKWYWDGTKTATRKRCRDFAKCLSGMVGRAVGAIDETVYQAKRLLRLSEQCKNCGKRCSPGQGRLSPEVDPFWYCDSCWLHYERHTQCGRCNEWRVRGKLDEELGYWVCSGCERLLPKEPEQEVAAEDTDGIAPVVGAGPSLESEIVRPNGPSSPMPLPASAEGDSTVEQKKPGATSETDPVLATSEWRWIRGKRFLVQTRQVRLVDVAPSLVAASSSAEAPAPEENGIVQEPLCAAVAAEGPSQAPTVQKTAMWQLVERSTGLAFASADESLSRLDSLRRTKLASAVRREASKFLTRDIWNRCKTLGELLSAIEHLAPEPRTTQVASSTRSDSTEHAVWGIMWQNKCQWTLRRNSPLPEATLREALSILADRHPALRAELADPMFFFIAVQQALSVFTLWGNRPRAAGAWGGAGIAELRRIWSRLIKALERLIHWAFRHSWGRVRATAPDGLRWLTVLERAASADEAQKRLWKNMPDFYPPVQVVLAQHGEGTTEGAIVHIMVTHMLSDGYSIVPLLMDLAQLVARQEAASPDLVHVPPPVPSALAALEDRLFRSISGGESLSDGVTQEQIFPVKVHRHPTTMHVTIQPQVVAALRQAALHLAVTDEILMLTALGSAVGHLGQQARVSFVMVAPQRDGPGESEMVGLFADIRLLTLSLEGLSYAGLALELHQLVKERRWGPPPILVQGDVPFINFEWTELESHHGFSQLPFSRSGVEMLQNPLKVAVDQPDLGTWRMRTAFDHDVYSKDDRERFYSSFLRGLRSLLEDPLQLVWSQEDGAAVPELSTEAA